MFSRKYFNWFFQLSLFPKIFLSGFILTFLFDGIGLLPKHLVFISFLLFAIIVGVLTLKSKSKGLFMSAHSLVLFIGYLSYLFFISFYSLNVQVSFEFTVFLLSLLLLFFVSGLYWKEMEKPFLYILLGVGVILCVYSLFLQVLLFFPMDLLLPRNGFQFVYAYFGSNHLGEFLVFPLLISFSFYLQQKKNYFLYFFLFFFIFFLLSYSRAGYLGLIIGMALLYIHTHTQFSKKQQYLLMVIGGGILFFFLLSTFRGLLESLIPFLKDILPANPKSVLDTRESYIVQGLKGFLEYRFYGVGLGNFPYVSHMFTQIPHWTTVSSHNIFLDVLVSTGTVGFLLFIYFSFRLLNLIKQFHTSIFAVLLLAWCTMAQFDYIHLMYSYLVLFPLFLLGLFHASHKQFNIETFFVRTIIIIFLTIFVAINIGSYVAVRNHQSELARIIYPLQESAYTSDLEERAVLDTYIRFFPGEPDGLKRSAKMYEKEAQMMQAIEHYEKAFRLDPFADIQMAEKIYNLKIKHVGQGSAKWFADTLFRKLHNETGEKVLSYDQWVRVNKLCQEVYKLHCRYTFR